MSTTTTKTSTTKKSPAKSRRKPVPAPQVEITQDDALSALAALGPRGHRMIPVANLVPHPQNPRKDLGDLTELVASVEASGVLQNLTVVPDPGDETRFRVVIGHRRAAAAQMAGLEEVPANVDPDMSPSEQLALMLAENVHRAQLTVVEEADGYQALLDESLSRSEIARRVGTPKSTVDKRLRLAAMPAAVKAKVHQRQATLEDAFRLEEAGLGPEATEALAAELGSSQFGWKMQDAIRAKRLGDHRAELVAQLVERGVTEAEQQPSRDEWAYVLASPENIQAADSSWRYYVTNWHPGLDLFRPRPDAEVEDEPDPEAAARDAEEQQAIAAVETAAALRTEFITPILSGTRRLDAKAATAVAVAFTIAAATEAVHAPDEGGPWMRRLNGDTAHEYPPAERDYMDCLIADTSVERVMLTMLAERYEDDGQAHHRHWEGGLLHVDSWRAGWVDDPTITSWYSLLVTLGYEPSQPELDTLARGDDPEEAE